MTYIKERSMVPVVLLYFFTLGIYPIYIYFKLFSEIKNEAELNNTEKQLMHPFPAFLLLIITFGIYYFYYAYKASHIMRELGNKTQTETYDVALMTFLAIVLEFLFFFLLINESTNYSRKIKMISAQNQM